MSDTTYNGWSNYETWLANLWLTNSQGDYEWLEETAREAMENNDCDAEGAANDMADTLESWLDDMMEQATGNSGLLADLLNAAARSINWHEIAANHIGDLTVYSAGWNMPGFLPDSEPARFLDADAAMEYIREQAALVAEQDEMGEEAEERVADWAADSKGEFGETFSDYHYFVAIV